MLILFSGMLLPPEADDYINSYQQDNILHKHNFKYQGSNVDEEFNMPNLAPLTKHFRNEISPLFPLITSVNSSVFNLDHVLSGQVNNYDN